MMNGEHLKVLVDADGETSPEVHHGDDNGRAEDIDGVAIEMQCTLPLTEVTYM